MEYYKFKEKYKGADGNVIGKILDVSILSGEEQQKAALKLNAEVGIEKIREYANAAKEFRDELIIPMRNKINELIVYEQQLEKNLNERDLNQYLFSNYTKYSDQVSIYLEDINSVLLKRLQQALAKKIKKCELRLQMYNEIDKEVDEFTPGRHR